MNKNEIIKQLNKNRAKNISMIGIIENYGFENSFKYGDSLLIKVKTDHLWYYPASNNKKELMELLKKYGNQTNYFASLEEWMLPIISRKREIDWELKTKRLILPERASVNFELKNKSDSENKFKIKELKSKDADFIFAHSHYQEFTSKAYIKERIDTDCSAGIFIKGELAAWGLTHDDGAIGFIHVRKNFRKRAYAHLIMEQLIREKRKHKREIFLNVEPKNLTAKKLFYSLGFEFDRMVSWIKLKEKRGDAKIVEKNV